MAGSFGDGSFGEGAFDGESVYTTFGVDLNPVTFNGTGTININPSVADILEDQRTILMYAAEVHAWNLTTPFVETSTTTYTTFDSATKEAHATLSNGNLTVSHSVNDQNTAARTALSVSSGKYYCEFTLDLLANEASAGFCNASQLSTQWLVTTLNSIAIDSGGNVWLNSTPVVAMGGPAAGQTVCMAVDFTNHLAWWRVNSGNWNNNGAANPATGVGGYDYTTGGLNAGPYTAAVSLLSATGATQFTANFGATAFAFTAPTGFVGWGTTTTTSDPGVIYVATQEFGTLPSDTPDSQPFTGALDQPLSVRRSILGTDIGVFTVGDGILEINNTDASYDYLLGNYAIDGRSIVVKAGLLGDLYSTEFITVFNGTASDWTISEDAVHIVLRDFSYRLSVPAQENLYGGTGRSDGGSDLTHKRKPRAFGFLLNVEPPAVSAPDLIYQLNDGRIHNVNAVYDRGVPLSPSVQFSPDATTATDFATYTALEAAAVNAGGYVTCLAEGFIKLGSIPSGTVTVDFEGDSTGGVFIASTGAIIRRILTTSTDLSDPDDLFVSSFTDMELLQADDIGYYLGTDSTDTVADVIAALMRGVGGWGGFRRDGTFELRVFRTPDIIDAITSDPYTRLLLHGNGNPGSTTFIDELGHAVAGVGNVSISADSPDTSKFGGGAINFNASVSPDQKGYIVITPFFDLSPSSDFTIDFWVLAKDFTTSADATLFTRSHTTNFISGIPASPIHIRLSSSSLLVQISSDALNNDIVNITDASLSAGTWYHIALARGGNVYYYFRNGTLIRSVNSTRTPYFSADAATLGGRVNKGTAEGFFHGYIEEFRYSAGIARWTSNFPVPTAAYTVVPSISSTPIARYDKTNIVTITREPLPTSITPLPWRHRVKCLRNWTVQTDLAGAVTAAQRTFAAEAYRLAVASDNTIRTNHPFAKDPDPIESYFHRFAAAQTEADRRLILYNEEASMFRMTVPAASALRVNLGDVIHVTYDRWDLTEGRKLTVVEINEDAAANRFEVVAYG